MNSGLLVFVHCTDLLAIVQKKLCTVSFSNAAPVKAIWFLMTSHYQCSTVVLIHVYVHIVQILLYVMMVTKYHCLTEDILHVVCIWKSTALCVVCKAWSFLYFLQQMKCLFDGQCKIDINTRRFCPFCRLKKCLDVGMKKHLILG